MRYSFSESIVPRRQAEDSAIARRIEGNNDIVDIEMELLARDVNGWIQHRKTSV